MQTLSALDPLRRDVEIVSRLSAVPTLLRVVSEVTGLRFSAIARVTADQWVACAVNDEVAFGLEPGGTLDVATTLCKDVRDSGEPVVIDHASADPIYCDHPAPRKYGFESYIAVPIFLTDGSYFGNVFGFDPLPVRVKQPKLIAMMKLFGELVSLHLAAEARQRQTEAQLLDAQETAELREQFIAVLGHDLRNPLGSVVMGAELLLRETVAESHRSTLERIRASGRRMTALVADLLDLARARLGSGIGLAIAETSNLAAALRHVVAELESAHGDRDIRFAVDLATAVRCDSERICQLLSNLLANAIEHGMPGRPIEVHAVCEGSSLRVSVHNEGPPIPAETLPLLFRPYTRASNGSRNGLGLGLYIASEIAKAHGGTLEVRSTADDGTRFTFAMPIAEASRR